MLMNRHKPRRSGFTLIELLVVIAIIAILAAILFPVFAKAREKARQASCSSNEKQLGIAIVQYVQDFDEVYPCDRDSIYENGWGEEIYPYVKSSGVYTCPDDTTMPFDLRGNPGGAVDSYAMNSNLLEAEFQHGLPNPTPYTPSGISQSQMNAPAITVELFECANIGDFFLPPIPGNYHSAMGNGGYEDYGGTAGFGLCSDYGAGVYATGNLSGAALGQGQAVNTVASPDTPTPSPGTNPGNTPGRHSGGSNFLCCDGHVKWFNGVVVSGGRNAATAMTPGENQFGYGNSLAAGTGNLTVTGVNAPMTLTFSVN